MNFRPTTVLALCLLMPAMTTGFAQAQTWEFEEAVTGLAPGRLLDFQIAVSKEGAVGLAYYGGTTNDLFFVERSPGPGGVWGNRQLVARYSSNSLAFILAYDPVTDNPTIAYTAWRVRTVSFARRDNYGSWVVETIDGGASRLNQQMGMAYSPEGTPWVFYGGKREYPTVAHFDGIAWQREAIYHDRGMWNSIAVGPGDDPNVAVGFITDANNDGRLDSLFYADRMSGWEAVLIPEPDERGIIPFMAFDPLDGTPTMAWELRSTIGSDPPDGAYRLSRFEDDSWLSEDIDLPPGEPIADTYMSPPVYTTTGEIITTFSGPQRVHLGRRTTETLGSWSHELILEELVEPAPQFGTDAALHPTTDELYVAIAGMNEGTSILVASKAFASACTENADCDDGNQCTDDSCDTASGECNNNPNFDPCDDGNECTDSDSCNGDGICTGSLVDDGDPCFGGACCGGACVAPACALDNHCEDGEFCTLNTCQDWQDPCSASCQSVPNPDPLCSCLPKRAACSNDAECCSNKCRGGKCR